MPSHVRTVVCAIVLGSIGSPAAPGQVFDAGGLVGPESPAQVLHAADFDLDGDVDIVFGDSLLQFMHNEGDLHFSEPVVITTELAEPRYVLAGDVDADGDPDVLANWPDQGILSWHSNDVGAFAPTQLVAVASITRNFALGDVDNNGTLDVVAPVDNGVAWFSNLGGAFGPATPVASPEVDWVSLADMNGDGSLDILGSKYQPNFPYPMGSAFWCAADGTGDFGAAAQIHGAYALLTITALDADNDGDPDPFLTSSSKIEWYEEVAGGVFALREVISSSSGGVIGASDIDLDGDLDLVAGSASGSLSWYENIAAIVYGSVQALSPLVVLQLEVLDLDGDSDDDVVVASPGGVYMFKNQFISASAWSFIGAALPGSSIPELTGSGDLTPGSIATVELTSAPVSASSFLVLGLSAYNVPFKTGVLVPKDDLLVALTTTPQGDLSITLTWPAAIPPGVETYWQFWILDALGPEGFSSSNGLLGVSQ